METLWGFKTRIDPPYPHVRRKRRLGLFLRIIVAWTGTLKNSTKCLWCWGPDCRSNFFSPSAHLCAITYITEISLIMTLSNQSTLILTNYSIILTLSGTVQTQQPGATQPSQPPTSSGSTPPGKKGKKQLQRAICPKPQGSKGAANTIATSGANLLPTGLLVPSAPPQGVWLTKEGEGQQPMDVLVPVAGKKSSNKSRSKSSKVKTSSENIVTSTSGATSTEGGSETDILAKAAESIFSSEISPGNFYNPANEDNPLQIDTSVCDGEEESSSKSPMKEVINNENKSKPEDVEMRKNVEELSNLDSGGKASSIEQQESNAEKKSRDENEILDMFKDTEDPLQMSKSGDDSIENDALEDILNELKEANAADTPKKSKRGKKEDKSKVNQEILTEIPSVPLELPKKSQPKKNLKEKELVNEEKLQEKDAVLQLPDSITFSANDLPDVLDQVEQLGSGFKEPSPAPPSNKKIQIQERKE